MEFNLLLYVLRSKKGKSLFSLLKDALINYKKFKKPIDIFSGVCYNKTVERETTKQKEDEKMFDWAFAEAFTAQYEEMQELLKEIAQEEKNQSDED